jgi:hypothetical protein
MTNRRRQDQGLSGALRWFLVFGVVLYGIVATLMWPFRRAMRLIPGRREKMFRAFDVKLRSAIPSAQELVRELAAGDSGLDAKMAKEVDRLQKALDLAARERKWPEDIDVENPWNSAIEILERAKCVGAIDHKANVDELKMALTPLLRKRRLKFDWTFLKGLEESRDWHALKNKNLLPILSDRLAPFGYVLTQVDDGSDNYLFGLCTPESFCRIESLASGDHAIRRFSHATRPSNKSLERTHDK